MPPILIVTWTEQQTATKQSHACSVSNYLTHAAHRGADVDNMVDSMLTFELLHVLATDRMICEFALHWIGVGLTRTTINRLKHSKYKMMGHCVILNDFFNCIDKRGLMKAAEQHNYS